MLEDVQMRHSTSPTISSHSSVHGDLLPYSSLMKWMRDCENQRFAEVTEVCVCLSVCLSVCVSVSEVLDIREVCVCSCNM